MGSAASKTASKGAPRKYPTRAAGASPAQASRRQQPAGSFEASRSPQSSPSQPPPGKEEFDAREDDVDFASRLRQMGIVQPNPTFSPSSTAGAAPPRPVSSTDVGGHDADMLRQIQQHRQQYASASGYAASTHAQPNATLSVLEARRRIQEQATADDEGQSSGPGGGRSQGREFIKASTIRDILVLRERGVDAAVIEARLHLKPGVVKRLGPRGLFEVIKMPEKEEEKGKENEKEKRPEAKAK